MRCYACNSTETEELKYFRGAYLGSVWTCTAHKSQIAEKKWEDVSGIVLNAHQADVVTNRFNPHFGPPTGPNAPQGITLGSPGTANQNINAFQSGLANVPSSEDTSNRAAQYANASDFSGLVRYVSGAAQAGWVDLTLFAYMSGNNITVVNPIANSVIASGTNASNVLQQGLNTMTLGQVMHVNNGTYNLTSSLIIPTGVSINGERTPWGRVGGTVFKAVSGNPAVIFSGGVGGGINSIFFEYNNANYAAGLITLQYNCIGIKCDDLAFGDNGLNALSGTMIEMNNGGANIGPTQNFFNNIESFGFNTCVRALLSGAAAASGAFINGNVFTNCLFQNFGAQMFQLVGSSTMDYDGNIWSNIETEMAGTSAQCLFDFSTQFTGHSHRNKHIAVYGWDFPANAVYANIGNVGGIELETHGCEGDHLMSGNDGGGAVLNAFVKHNSLLTIDKRQSAQVTSSGVGTTSWFLPYQLGLWNGPPSFVTVQANNSGTAAAGSPFVSNIAQSGFTVSAPNSVNSGVILQWTWYATM